MSVRRTVKLNYYPLLVKQFWSDHSPQKHRKNEQREMQAKQFGKPPYIYGNEQCLKCEIIVLFFLNKLFSLLIFPLWTLLNMYTDWRLISAR